MIVQLPARCTLARFVHFPTLLTATSVFTIHLEAKIRITGNVFNPYWQACALCACCHELGSPCSPVTLATL